MAEVLLFNVHSQLTWHQTWGKSYASWWLIVVAVRIVAVTASYCSVTSKGLVNAGG
jgi:hypothetical protein